MSDGLRRSATAAATGESGFQIEMWLGSVQITSSSVRSVSIENIPATGLTTSIQTFGPL